MSEVFSDTFDRANKVVLLLEGSIIATDRLDEIDCLVEYTIVCEVAAKLSADLEQIVASLTLHVGGREAERHPQRPSVLHEVVHADLVRHLVGLV